MTYKAIVKELIRLEAEKWVENLLKENDIPYNWTSAEITEMENDKAHDNILWCVAVSIRRVDYTKVFVGGTADDCTGICCSVVWDSKMNIIWMAVEETRKSLGITEFKIA